MKKLYLVTGAKGHLGSTVIKALLDKGEEVRALILETDKGPSLDSVTYYTGDVRDKESMRAFFEHKCDEDVYLIHTAGLISIQKRTESALYDVNVKGTKNIISLSFEYGIKRLVYVSSVHALEEKENVACLREDNNYDRDSVEGEYAKSKAEASRLVLDAVSLGLDAVICLPSGIIGPGDDGRNHIVELCKIYLKGKLPMAVKGGYDMVDVRDVSDGIIRAAEVGRKGESYILSGSSVTIKELIKYMAGASGKRERPCIPIFFARIISPFVELDAKRKKKRPLFTKYSLYTLKSNTRFSHDKAAIELGYHPRDISESVKDMVSYLLKKST